MTCQVITTSVAEDGLNFPASRIVMTLSVYSDFLFNQACDLAVRCDPLQHLVGYVQGLGRARNKASTFIIMIQTDDFAQLTR